MKKTIEFYKQIIKTHPEKKEGDETSLEHLSWMLCEMSSMKEGEGKICRWFGFVHCAMFTRGLIDFSKDDIFKGIFVNKCTSNKHLYPEPITSLISRYFKIVYDSDIQNECERINNDDVLKVIVTTGGMDFNDPLFHLHLGFIQCAMLVNGLVNISEERELTRCVF